VTDEDHLGVMTVSVIIPTFNRAHVLRRAIDSVIAQTFQDLELIVVDDGSIDGTDKIVQSYEYPRLQYERHRQNRGQNAALNSGLKISGGEFSAFLDSDDEWHPEFLQRTMERFSLNERLGCVYTWANYCDAATGRCEVSKKFSIEGNIYIAALAQGYVSHMITMVARRSLLYQAGLFDEEFEVCQDDDICIRLARLAEFGLIPEPLATIHQDAGNQTTRNRDKYAEGAWRLVNKFAGETVTHCGDAVLSRHYERCGDLFWQADNKEMALEAYQRANRLHRRFLVGLKHWSLRMGLEHDLAAGLKRFCIGVFRR